MKGINCLKIFSLVLTLLLATEGFGGVRELGNGSNFLVLEGFEEVKDEKGKLRKAILDAVKIAEKINLKNAPELLFLKEEIEGSRYIKIDREVYSEGNRNPGDYTYGSWLVATTEPYRGAPTKIYNNVIDRLSLSQLVQMVIHEALHRSLYAPVNTQEKIVERLTNIITQYERLDENLRRYLDFVKTMKISWAVKIATYTSESALKAVHLSDRIHETSNRNTRLHMSSDGAGGIELWDSVTEKVYRFNSKYNNDWGSTLDEKIKEFVSDAIDDIEKQSKY